MEPLERSELRRHPPLNRAVNVERIKLLPQSAGHHDGASRYGQLFYTVSLSKRPALNR